MKIKYLMIGFKIRKPSKQGSFARLVILSFCYGIFITTESSCIQRFKKR